MKKQMDSMPGDAPASQDRRKAIKKITAGVGVVVGCSVLPEKWISPIVAQIALPAHAATSTVVAETSTTASDSSTTASETVEYNTSEVYTLSSIDGNDKRFTWLNQTGSAYGGQVKFVFSNGCGELVVPDAKVTHGADGNSSNHNQAFYFCGTDYAPGAAEYNAGKASVFTPPGCAAASVTMHYNKA